LNVSEEQKQHDRTPFFVLDFFLQRKNKIHRTQKNTTFNLLNKNIIGCVALKIVKNYNLKLLHLKLL
jgi:hypothetical protein